MVERIVQRTDGVPLYIEELTKTLVEGGLNIAEADIPETLQASLLARLDRLGPEAKEIAQIGAVVGREFSHDLIASTIAGEKQRASHRDVVAYARRDNAIRVHHAHSICVPLRINHRHLSI